MTSCPGARPSSRCDLFGSGVSPGNQVQGVGLVGLEFVALRPVGQAMNNTFTSCYQQDGGYGFV